MAEDLRPTRGGFLRPFGTAIFIREFLAGRGDQFGALPTDPDRGSPQEAIHSSYKQAIHMAMAEDAAAWDAEAAIRRGKPMTPEEVEERSNYYLARIPSKLTRMRYHSFLTYFGMLKRLGWVEPTGEVEEPSETQEAMALKSDERPRETGQPRIYYRLTDKGRAATLAELSNPLRLLYPHFTAEYFREARKAKRYYIRRPPRVAAPRPKAPLTVEPPPPPTPKPPAPKPTPPPAPTPSVEIPAFQLPEKPGRGAAQKLLKHLQSLLELDPDLDAPQVKDELERLGDEFEGWVEIAEKAHDKEDEKDNPDEDRLDRLQEQHDALVEIQQALGYQDVEEAIKGLEEAFPPRAT